MTDVDSLTALVDKLSIDDNVSKSAIKIQRLFRGHSLRSKRLPNILYAIKQYLIARPLKCSTQNKDGRLNSCLDEDTIIESLIDQFPNRIRRPKIRMWYDILVKDYQRGWIPINIKTTTTKTSDNAGNLAMCVQAYTDAILDLSKPYDNGKMSILLIDKLKSKKYNRDYKKDYYFVVLNKTNSKDVIINSVRGLTILTPNLNNLPFQICWNKNRTFKPQTTDKATQAFIDCLQKPKPSWKESFLCAIRDL